MSRRINKVVLNAKVELLNEVTNSPITAYSENAEGVKTANVGHFYICSSYGGHALYRIDNELGGCSDFTQVGFTSASDLYDLISVMIRTVKMVKDIKIKEL